MSRAAAQSRRGRQALRSSLQQQYNRRRLELALATHAPSFPTAWTMPITSCPGTCKAEAPLSPIPSVICYANPTAHHWVGLEVVPVIADLVQVAVAHPAVLYVDEDLPRFDSDDVKYIGEVDTGTAPPQARARTSLSPRASALNGMISSFGPFTRAPMANCARRPDLQTFRTQNARVSLGVANLRQAHRISSHGDRLLSPWGRIWVTAAS